MAILGEISTSQTRAQLINQTKNSDTQNDVDDQIGYVIIDVKEFPAEDYPSLKPLVDAVRDEQRSNSCFSKIVPPDIDDSLVGLAQMTKLDNLAGTVMLVMAIYNVMVKGVADASSLQKDCQKGNRLGVVGNTANVSADGMGAYQQFTEAIKLFRPEDTKSLDNTFYKLDQLSAPLMQFGLLLNTMENHRSAYEHDPVLQGYSQQKPKLYKYYEQLISRFDTCRKIINFIGRSQNVSQFTITASGYVGPRHPLMAAALKIGGGTVNGIISVVKARLEQNLLFLEIAIQCVKKELCTQCQPGDSNDELFIDQVEDILKIRTNVLTFFESLRNHQSQTINDSDPGPELELDKKLSDVQSLV